MRTPRRSAPHKGRDGAPEAPLRIEGGSEQAKDERWQLLHRVAASPLFEKSNRLRELLLFLGERALLAPDSPIREQEIGVELFGRSPGYDTSQDTLVRVQASQLRKKLQQYFEGEGKEEPAIIDLPKGSYLPVFRVRDSAAPECGTAAAKRRRSFWLPWGVAALLGALCIALLVQNTSLRRRPDLRMRPTPTLNRFWRQMLGNGLHNYLVVSDANLVVFEDALREHVSIQDYQNKAFESLANARIEDPAARKLMLNIVGRLYTGIADAAMARKLGLVCALNGLALDVVIARDISASQIAAHNTILLGSRRANPWAGIFEEKLNFRCGFDESPRAAYFTNKSPKPGEESEYRGSFGRLGYCRIAVLPNPKGAGNVMLITGTDISSTDAGGEFVTSEAWLRLLRTELKLGDSEPFPYFEILLRGIVVNNSVPQFEVVTARRH